MDLEQDGISLHISREEEEIFNPPGPKKGRSRKADDTRRSGKEKRKHIGELITRNWGNELLVAEKRLERSKKRLKRLEDMNEEDPESPEDDRELMKRTIWVTREGTPEDLSPRIPKTPSYDPDECWSPGNSPITEHRLQNRSPEKSSSTEQERPLELKNGEKRHQLILNAQGPSSSSPPLQLTGVPPPPPPRTRIIIPPWRSIMPGRYDMTLHAINILQENKLQRNEHCSAVDAAIGVFINDRNVDGLLWRLEGCRERMIEAIEKRIRGEREEDMLKPVKLRKFRNARWFRLVMMNNRVLPSIRFDRATSGLRAIRDQQEGRYSIDQLQLALYQLKDFRDMHETINL